MAEINQVAWDFSNLQFSIDIVEKRGTEVAILDSLPIGQYTKEINYAPKIEFEDMFGGSRLPQDTTDGQASFEASWTLEMYGCIYIVERVQELGRGIANVAFNIGIQFYRAQIPLHYHFIQFARVMNPEFAFKAGTEALSVPISLKPKNLFLNGTDIFGNPIT